jgi:sulfur transfer complex TusBCD TusB component (DsrH family)
MLHYVHSSLIYNSQKLERTQMSLNRGMDTENVVHLHNGVYSAIKNNDFMKFIGEWMELDNIIPSEVTQSQNTTHDMHSLISGY